MIGIFRTNISTGNDRNRVIEAIHANFNVASCNVDLEDCDKVLRIVALKLPIAETAIIQFIQRLGYQCETLE